VKENEMEEQWFTVDEVARRLKVSDQTVRRWLRAGALVGRNFGGRTGYRIPEAELERFLRSEVGGRPEQPAPS
jgi:excisionase family DNA binding protein